MRTAAVVGRRSHLSKRRGRPFEPGNQLGRGRPKGSRNRNGGLVKTILEEYAPHVTRKAISLALEGNPQALRLCMERIMPVPRDAAISMKLPNIKSAVDVASAAEKVTRGIAKGVLSPSEAEILMNVLQCHSRVIESSETEKRVEKLEKHLATTKQDCQHDGNEAESLAAEPGHVAGTDKDHP
jgi:hypothetical protein